ncbi:Uncharacterized conserved protein YndB, AHSA1/START domain [Bryocella elongata]|uniref:Uncharacterized conserved protein YndB, AHSA1/START domain n=1 Tax=Bryocella elongata TaxID=863522 RepID=A0A1H6BKA8_9BACT|nr:SRPBCC domain-containing protein [Bryocella elongata]SEG61104.1 Uncharacterized conserved protein YndB, AHSA1/START domain [Bryocella elongata]
MSTSAMPVEIQTPAAHELKISRIFNAPRELVWKAFTEADMMQEWMGPRGFGVTSVTWPAEAGGQWARKMEGCAPATQKMAYLGQSGTVLEMRPPELLVFTFAWDDRNTVGLPPSPYQENTVTVRLEEQGNKTVMHFTQGPFASASECNGHTGGWNSSFDKLTDLLSTQQPGRTEAAGDIPTELHLQRVFKAPMETVFAVWTNPAHLAQWWGPKGFTNPHCEFERRNGGRIEIDMRSPDGVIYPMAGTVIEFYPPHRFHFTASALDAEGNPLFTNWNSVFFEEVGGGTRVTLDVHVMNQTAQAPQYLKGMREGWTMSFGKLEEYLAAIA